MIPWEWPHSTVVCVAHAWRGCRATTLIPWECRHSAFLLCFTRCERLPGNNGDFLGAHIQRFSYVFHALRGCQVTKLIPCECPHSMFLVCFTTLRGCRVTMFIPGDLKPNAKVSVTLSRTSKICDYCYAAGWRILASWLRNARTSPAQAPHKPPHKPLGRWVGE